MDSSENVKGHPDGDGGPMSFDQAERASPTGTVFETVADLWDATSDGILGPWPIEGDCLHCRRPQFDTSVFVDFDGPLVSGSVVAAFVEQQDGGLHALGKFLHVTRDDRWWLAAYTGAGPESLSAWPFPHWGLPVVAIAPVVARLHVPRLEPHEPIDWSASAEFSRQLGHLGAPALKEWSEQGFPTRMELMIRTPAPAVERVRRHFSDLFGSRKARSN
jgi:hypothetical protein